MKRLARALPSKPQMPDGVSQPKVATPAFIPPYPPSWLNRLIDWIDRRPGPAWLSYLMAVVVLEAIFLLASILGGDDAVAVFGEGAFVFGFYPVYFLALMHYLDGQARSTLEAFRPALTGGDADIDRIRYELTTIPARGAWVASILAAPLAYVFIFAPAGPELLTPRRLPLEALAFVITLFTIAAFFVLAYHTVRQLRYVSRLHAQARSVNLLQPQPAYAFSRLTSRTAIGVIAFLYLDFLVNPPTRGVALPYFTFTGVALLLMLAAFLLPLLGMHQRLAREKARLLAEVNAGVELAYRGLQKQVESKSYDQVDSLEKALSGFLRMREVIGRLSTWPWQPETLRGMLAAVVLPMVLWLIQFGLQRWLG
jgi:hypothetical protein